MNFINKVYKAASRVAAVFLILSPCLSAVNSIFASFVENINFIVAIDSMIALICIIFVYRHFHPFDMFPFLGEQETLSH